VRSGLLSSAPAATSETRRETRPVPVEALAEPPLHAADLVLVNQPVGGLVLGCGLRSVNWLQSELSPLVLRLAESICWPEDRLRSTHRSGSGLLQSNRELRCAGKPRSEVLGVSRHRSLCIALVAALAAGGCESERPDPLVGTWLLKSVSARTADGTIDAAPYGETPTGYLTYTPDGYMQVILSFSQRALLSSDWRASPMEERAAAFATSLSYAGRYTAVGDRVTHHVDVSSDPNRVGTSIERSVSIDGERLTLTTPPTQVGGDAREFSLTWIRASSPGDAGSAP